MLWCEDSKLYVKNLDSVKVMIPAVGWRVPGGMWCGASFW